MDFDGDSAVAAYFDLARRRPDFFRNDASPDTIRILTHPEEIARAQQDAFEQRLRNGLSSADIRVGLLAEDPFATFVRDAVRFPDGKLGLYNRLLEGRCVAAIPIYESKLVLVRLFRHGLRSWSLEFPRGACDAGETSEDALQRELREEIGAEVVDLVEMGEFTPGGSVLTTRATFYTARIDRIGEPDKSDAIARIELHDVEDVERMIHAGEIIDGWSMSLFLRARLAGLV